MSVTANVKPPWFRKGQQSVINFRNFDKDLFHDLIFSQMLKQQADALYLVSFSLLFRIERERGGKMSDSVLSSIRKTQKSSRDRRRSKSLNLKKRRTKPEIFMMRLDFAFTRS
jgi:hypothetical protein